MNTRKSLPKTRNPKLGEAMLQFPPWEIIAVRCAD